MRAASPVARRFSHHAATYERFATVQREMAEGVAASARALAPRAQRVLELGCGTGTLTRLLAYVLPDAEITAVDFAEGMLAEARTTGLGADARIRLVLADAETLPLEPRSYDLVASSAALQWLQRPGPTIASLSEGIAPGGWMLHATFGPRTFGELHAAFAKVEAAHGLAPAVHWLPLASASEWGRRLLAAGLGEVRCRSRVAQVEYAGCRALLEAIRRTGASASPPADPRRVRLLPEVIRRYDHDYRVRGGVRATYEFLELAGRRVA